MPRVVQCCTTPQDMVTETGVQGRKHSNGIVQGFRFLYIEKREMFDQVMPSVSRKLAQLQFHKYLIFIIL